MLNSINYVSLILIIDELGHIFTFPILEPIITSLPILVQVFENIQSFVFTKQVEFDFCDSFDNCSHFGFDDFHVLVVLQTDWFMSTQFNRQFRSLLQDLILTIIEVVVTLMQQFKHFPVSHFRKPDIVNREDEYKFIHGTWIIAFQHVNGVEE